MVTTTVSNRRSETINSRMSPSASTSNDNNAVMDALNDNTNNNNSNNENRRKSFFSILSCIVQPTRRMQQRIAFQNRWKKKGVKFDPNFHQALNEVESEQEDGMVINEIQKGYMLNDRLLRPALVSISKKKTNANS